MRAAAAAVLAVFLGAPALAQPIAPPAKPMTTAPIPPAAAAAAVNPSDLYVVRYDHWTDADERGFGEFITGIGESDCHTVNACLHGPGNPFRASDSQWTVFHSD